MLSLLAPGNVRMANVPLQRSLTPGRIAQLEERGPYKAEVPGSIPGPPTRNINRAIHPSNHSASPHRAEGAALKMKQAVVKAAMGP